MDETENSQAPPGLSPQVGPTIPTSRREPPFLEGLAPGYRPPQRDDEFDWFAPLHNRLIIAGFSLLILLALTAVVLLVFSQGDGDPRTGPRVGVAGNVTTTPTPTGVLTALTLATTTLRNGPDTSFSPLGTVPRGARLPVIGRNADDTWLQVRYPPGSTIQGWIDVSFLEVTGDLTGVDIAGPGSGPDIIVPTSLPTTVVEKATDTPAPTDTPAAELTDEPTSTPELTTTPLENETPPPVETPAQTATQAAPPTTDTPVATPDGASPTMVMPQASAGRLTAPATLIGRPQLSVLPGGVPRQATRRDRERAV